MKAPIHAYVTAAAGNFAKLVNNGGQSGSGSGTVTPGGPEEIIPIG